LELDVCCGVGERRDKTTHIPVFVFYIERDENEEGARKICARHS
jgi:hypothetical protein